MESLVDRKFRKVEVGAIEEGLEEGLRMDRRATKLVLHSILAGA
jgi:hypothetical protein